MRSITPLLILLFATSSYAQKSSDIKVTFVTSPPGATLVFSNGAVFEDTPMTLSFTVPKPWTKCEPIGSFTVRWVSGAETMADNLAACPQSGKNQTFYLTRPTGVPGVEVDAQYASDLQRLELMRRQLKLQLLLANQPGNPAAQGLQQFQQSLEQRRRDSLYQQRTQALQRTLHCTSVFVGSTIQSTCN